MGCKPVEFALVAQYSREVQQNFFFFRGKCECIVSVAQCRGIVAARPCNGARDEVPHPRLCFGRPFRDRFLFCGIMLPVGEAEVDSDGRVKIAVQFKHLCECLPLFFMASKRVAGLCEVHEPGRLLRLDLGEFTHLLECVLVSIRRTITGGKRKEGPAVFRTHFVRLFKR